MIDAREFIALTPHLSVADRVAILTPLQAAMVRFGITSKEREAHFLAQVLTCEGGSV